MEKAIEKYGKTRVKDFIFKKHPDSGRIHVMSADPNLFLPYSLTACRHPPFLSISPRADNHLLYVNRPENQVNGYLDGHLIYALTMEKGSHNLILFHTHVWYYLKCT